jgi:hypothetical protein
VTRPPSAFEKRSGFENAEIGGVRPSDACSTIASALQHPDAALVSFGSIATISSAQGTAVFPSAADEPVLIAGAVMAGQIGSKTTAFGDLFHSQSRNCGGIITFDMSRKNMSTVRSARSALRCRGTPA